MIRDIFKTIYGVLSGRGMARIDDRILRDSETRDAREVASRFSRGSVAIQEGAFVTKGDLERERAHARSHPLPG
jgi:hypothetical protein